MIAALPMYERPETADALDRYWALIRGALRDAGLDAPDRLTRDADPWAIWQNPDLVLAQTCGLPFRAKLHGQVALVGTPDFGLQDIEPGFYRSVIVMRAADQCQSLSDLPSATLAYNEPLSQSGWAAPVAAAQVSGIRFQRCVKTGAHLDSALAVIRGNADLAAIDAITWRNLTRYEPSLTGRLRVLTRTDPTPGLPYITAQIREAWKIAQAVSRALLALSDEDRDLLGIRALVQIPASEYLALPIPPAP